MNPNVPSIEQLKEIALPAPVSYAPQTWGWWVLLGLLVLTALIIAARRYWQWRRDRYRREALVRLAQLQQRSDDLSALRELPELLKRTALSMPNTVTVGARLARDAGAAIVQVIRVIVHREQALLPQKIPLPQLARLESWGRYSPSSKYLLIRSTRASIASCAFSPSVLR
jgi:hypothetical protein